MKLQKDTVLDIIYSVFISLILILESNEIPEDDLIFIEFFRSLMIVSLFFLWILSLSKKFQHSIFNKIKENTSSLGDTFLIIKQSSEVKIASFILLYMISSIVKTGFNMDYRDIFLRSAQIYLTAVFVICMYSMVLSIGGENIRLKFFLFLIGPFLAAMLMAYLFQNFILEIFLLIPTNLYLIFHESSMPLIGSGIYILGVAFFSFILFWNIKELKKAKRKVVLPFHRVN